MSRLATRCMESSLGRSLSLSFSFFSLFLSVFHSIRCMASSLGRSLSFSLLFFLFFTRFDVLHQVWAGLSLSRSFSFCSSLSLSFFFSSALSLSLSLSPFLSFFVLFCVSPPFSDFPSFSLPPSLFLSLVLVLFHALLLSHPVSPSFAHTPHTHTHRPKLAEQEKVRPNGT